MFLKFSFLTPEIHFGNDAVLETGTCVRKLNCARALIVSGPHVKQSGAVEKVAKSLADEGVSYGVYITERTTMEPTTGVAEAVAEAARSDGADCIIGIGGGSVLDVAKMAAALINNPRPVREYFGKEKVPNRGIPTIMIPTTAGTGAEVTKHAIFLDEQTNVKKAVASSNLLPNVAIVDPMLTLTCPSSATAASGIDAFLHAAEPFLSKAANPITDCLSLQAVSIIVKNIGPAYADGGNIDARYNMSLASVMAGLVLNNAGTSLVHALAYPIGGEFHLNHGRSLTPILMACLRYIRVAKEERLAKLAEAMGENTAGLNTEAAANLALDAIRRLLEKLNLPACLEDCGITDRSKADRWAVEGHAEQRLLSRCARSMTVEDAKGIYLDAFKK